MRTIVIDCRFVGSMAGLGRYSREIISRMVRLGGARFVLLGPENVMQLMENYGSFEAIPTDIPHYSLREQTVLPGIIRRTNADILFIPHFNVPLMITVPFVMTVHDLILHAFPNRAAFHRRLAYRALMRAAIRRAAGIIVVSTFVRDEMRVRFGEAAVNRATIIGEGVGEEYKPRSAEEQQRVLDRYDLKLPFYLYVGNAKEHKNVRVLIDAYVEAGVRDVELVLVTSGKEVAALNPLPPGVRVLSHVQDAHLPALYSAAKAFCTASLYEGYGLPVAEALACGCPVIASNRAAIPEVANGHAMLIEPDVDSFAHALSLPLAKTQPYRAGSWDNAAERTLKLLLEQ